MANYSPESSQYNMPIDFRAPPPSPVAAGRRSSFANDEVLTDFLEHSLRVPDLVLPDRVFPRQKSIQTPPKLDWEVLNSSGSDDSISELNLKSIGRTGCFELVNHSISSDLIRLATNSGAGIFKLMPEQKAKISRSNERSYGFVEFHGEEERETSEEFVWCRDQALKLEMEGIWPTGFSNFSENMEMLMLEIEKVAAGILQLLQQNAPRNSTFDDFGTIQEDETAGSIVYLYKHSACIEEEEMTSSSLRYDVIRMLIRGSECSHALCIHLCDGSSEFHVYSKKGWVSFCPDPEALVITIGDQLQAWSGGEYKHVIGRPIFKSEEEEEEEEDCNISMAFLYSPAPNSIITNTNTSGVIIKDVKAGKNTISLVHQLMLALIFTLFYNVWSLLCPKS